MTDETEMNAEIEEIAESAPAETEEATGTNEDVEASDGQESEPAQESESNRVQERINKITAEKYAERRRAEELEARLRELEARQGRESPTIEGEPTLEDFDYDEIAYNKAYIEYKVKEQAKAMQEAAQREREQAKLQEVQANFHKRANEFAKKVPDYQETVNAIPELPPEILQAVIQSDHGVELAYYLGKHLDIADKIANSNPYHGAVLLGEVSAELKNSTVNKIKPSKAPEPISNYSTGGGTTGKDYSSMSMDELMKL